MCIWRVDSINSPFPLPIGSCWKLAICSVLGMGSDDKTWLDYRKRKLWGGRVPAFPQFHTFSFWLNNIFQVGSNFTTTMNEPNLDHLCYCFCKSLRVYTLLCALADTPAYVPSSYPTSTLSILVHNSWQPLVPAGLTSAAIHATLLPPEGTKYSLFHSLA